MSNVIGWLLPRKLKYRIFAAFVLLILLPFGLLNLYNYERIESLVQEKINKQSHDQLENLKGLLLDQMSIAFKTLIFLEQDSAVRKILSKPDDQNVLENKDMMEEKFKNLNNSFFLYNPSVYFTLLDLQGHVYTSYQPNEPLNYEKLMQNPSFRDAEKEEVPYRWVPGERNYVFRDLSTSPYLLSLYAVLRDRSNSVYGMARVSIDYSYWFQSAVSGSEMDQAYFIVTKEGETVARSVRDAELTDSIADQITSKSGNGYFIDEQSDSLINYSYMESVDWYIMNRIPLDVLFGEMNALKRQFFLTFFLLTAAFIGIAFIIAHTFTRPLAHLQLKMKDAIAKNFKIRLPERKYAGEVLDLTRNFNAMLKDMDELIVKLKTEQRQKDAVHFQMLLAQMNPHFLLNTLNTMKWIALRNGQTDISEMCVSLGKLLETSLNSDVDLIHLKDEMELIEAFLYIQKVRHRDSFDIRLEYDESLQFALVPKLSLQPLVENAIGHGISGLSERGLIQIRVRRLDQPSALLLEVEDNGIGLEASAANRPLRKRPGIGLTNVRERLRLLFKDEASVEVVALRQGTLIRLTFPFLLSTPFEQERTSLE
ncbi:histidine kinase [Paenibacillus sp. LHD-117]|uniref:sensor histidine kinase n=1 Tax=Paenibacillus sp. LHD-117 TaxID=3071412 RepID=UPI0027E1BB0B|nr:histidine kinase [Paenibacillus sp. LHD-117]MDQ6420045.1 histidine kinase [Paenibacillus sp. LHD-117]